MVDAEEKYDAISMNYDQLYTQPGSAYMDDEHAAAWLYTGMGYPKSKIVSLGCGTGQDIATTKASPDNFVGFDISDGMLDVARAKYPDYRFVHHDCRDGINEEADILVSMFGAPNYLGIDALIEAYKASCALHAFFVFYDEQYNDGVIEEYNKYSFGDLVTAFRRYGPLVTPLRERSNYYVVAW